MIHQLRLNYKYKYEWFIHIRVHTYSHLILSLKYRLSFNGSKYGTYDNPLILVP